MRYIYNKKELDILLDNIVYIVDTREKANSHIINYMEKTNKKYTVMKLDQGDYSAMIPLNDETKDIIQRTLYFNDDILIERKANLDEIINNILEKSRDEEGRSGERIEKEFMRVNRAGAKMVLLLENPNALDDIINHNYRSKYSPKAFYAKLQSLEAKYNIHIRYIDPKHSGMEITHIIKYNVRERLKG